MKKQFLILFVFISVLALSQVPQRFNKVIVTGDITSPKFIKTGSTADSVLLGNGSARSVNSLKTDTVNLSNRINAKATGNGTAYGNNTGDETLTSIKTKLGAATAVSDGYLKYQDWNTFNSKEPSFSKNTGFNKNFGTTTGTVLEGRTFGTAANSAVGDFIQNQNASAQPANMWIGGSIKSGGVTSTHLTLKGGIPYIDFMGAFDGLRMSSGLYGTETGGNSGSDYKIYFYSDNGSYLGNPLIIKRSTGEATFSSTVNSTGFLLNGNNLTSSLTANYLPKWNGSNLVNGLISDDGTSVFTNGNLTIRSSSPLLSITSDDTGQSKIFFGGATNSTRGSIIYSDNANDLWINTNGSEKLRIFSNGNVGIGYTTDQGYKLAVNGIVSGSSFYGNGSNLTGVQLPITLTTNGTSGAATFSGNVLNVPNYASTGTGGEFTSTFTNISNTTLSTATLAAYTNINGIINASVFGAVTSTSAGKCTFRVSVPTTIRSGRCAVISGVESGKTTSANIFIEGTGSTYVDISFIASAPSSILEFKLITMGY